MFLRQFQKIYIDDNVVHLPNLLTVNNITKSNSEARRIITSGGFKINDIKYLRSRHFIR